MKKTFFSILSLLCFAVSGAWAVDDTDSTYGIGKLIGSNGVVYDNASAVPNNVEISGMIAYINTSENWGLVIGPSDLYEYGAEGSGKYTQSVATGGYNSAGIGGGTYRGFDVDPSLGGLTIYGGKVTAQGGVNGAGIGSGQNGNCPQIKIYGGTVKAETIHSSAAAIGSGHGGTQAFIDIYGGNVTAKNENYGGAGIGAGVFHNSMFENKKFYGVIRILGKFKTTRTSRTSHT